MLSDNDNLSIQQLCDQQYIHSISYTQSQVEMNNPNLVANLGSSGRLSQSAGGDLKHEFRLVLFNVGNRKR